MRIYTRPNRNLIIALLALFLVGASTKLVQSQIPQSNVSGLVPSLASRPKTIRGLYNPEGLKRYREGFTEIGYRRDGTGLGGMDIICWTDSWLAYNGYSWRSDTAVATLRNLGQDAFNPPLRSDGTRYGGAGYIPVFGGSSGTWTTADPKDGSLLSDACASYDGTGITNPGSNWNFARFPNTGANDCRIRWTFAGSGTYAIRNRDRITGAELVATQASTYGDPRLDQKTDGDAFVATSGAVATIDCSQATTVRAKHWGQSWSGLTATNTNCVQVGSPASGSVFNDIMGIIAYCDDWDKGFRVQALTFPGRRMIDFYGVGGSSLIDYGLACVDPWTSSAPGSAAAGATRGKLFVINFMLNDMVADNGTTITVATFKAQLTHLVGYIKARPSRPCILYVIPPPGTSTPRLNLFPSYVAAIKQVMSANKDVMAVWDVCEFLGGGVNGTNRANVYTGEFTDLGIGNSDGTHLSNLGQSWLGYMLFQILSRRDFRLDANFQRVRRIADAHRDGTFGQYDMVA